MILVIAEKPSVGMSLAAVLGARERKDGLEETGVLEIDFPHVCLCDCGFSLSDSF